MTQLTHWTARLLLPSLCMMLFGCAVRTPTAAPAEMRAILAEPFVASNVQVSTASTLDPLEHVSGAMADTVKAIDIARDVALDNLANADTTAFKGSHTLVQEGGKVHTQLDFSQGSMESNGRNLDLGIQGQGFFKIKLANKSGDGIGYTRNGTCSVDDDGDLVVGMGDGYTLMPSIKIPVGTTDIRVATDGTVSVTQPGSSKKIRVGRFKLANFSNPEGLNHCGAGIFTETDTSGRGNDDTPRSGGMGVILQGFLEHSNVDITREMTRLRYLNHWRSTLVRAIGMRDQWGQRAPRFLGE